MGTKSRGWTSSSAIKIISFILILLFFIFSLNRLIKVIEVSDETGINPTVATLPASHSYQYFFTRNMRRLINYASRIIDIGGEESIRSGANIEWVPARRWWTDYNDYGISIGSVWGRTVHIYGEYTSEEERLRFEQEAIDLQLTLFNRMLENLNSTEGLLFYLQSGTTSYSNVSTYNQTLDFFMSHPVYFTISAEGSFSVSHRINSISFSSLQNGTILLAFTNEAADAFNLEFEAARYMYFWGFAKIIFCIIASLVLLVILLFGAGRHRQKEGIHFLLIDKPYLDLSFAVLLCFIIGIGVAFSFIEITFRYANYFTIFVWVSALGVLVLAPSILWILSLAKYIKAKRALRHTLIFVTLHRIFSIIRNFFTRFFMGIPLGGRLILRPFYHARVIYNIEKSLQEIAEGNFDIRLNTSPGVLGNIAESVNKISTGINTAVDERMKSERMKTELITNVSHDIRTPLTSIITYIDLLRQEGLTQEHFSEYLEILAKKSERLKTLTDELFEAAKATSGNIDVNLTELDFTSLIRQVLGELDETIQKSGLDFRINLPSKLIVLADGKLMWRVIENLLSNASKYAQRGSRVYLDAKKTDDSTASISIKNISELELNVDPLELTERFKRGDDARTDGGAGLGLSIAQSFVNAQGGKLEISIDGDLFKATVSIPIVEQF